MAKHADVPSGLSLPGAWQKMLVATATSIGPSPLFLFLAEHVYELSEVFDEALARLTTPEQWVNDGESPRDERFEKHAYELALRFSELLEAERQRTGGP